MKWHNLMILLASLVLVAGAFASSPVDELDEFSIPDDIDDGELDEDEEILRLLEDNRIVSCARTREIIAKLTKLCELQKEDLKRENEHARDMASKYHAEHGLAAGTEPVRMICKFLVN